MEFNHNGAEKKLGFVFAGIWAALFVFYLTWDGWLFEWRTLGLDGPNQHFDLDFFDMEWELRYGERFYHSTSNLHNLLFLCYFQFLLGWLGLVTGKDGLKQGAMALLPLSVGATVATLTPADHLCPIQIAYDVVHLGGMFIAVYLFYHYELDCRKAMWTVIASWPFYVISRIAVSRWPYWEYPTAYFSINQINEMPFDACGLEYGLAVLLLAALNKVVAKVNARTKSRKIRALVPVALPGVLCLLLLVAGLLEVQDISGDRFSR